ncbi:hypothetical protein IFO70_37070 [Phormidium tenue FACHB-886]|nr:hypothetical protein [Phormidium tenue FACHB-886]
MVNVNLGRLDLGEVEDRNGRLQRQGPGLRTDTYTFDTDSTFANVAIGSLSLGPFPRENIALVLFKDNDANGVINPGDTIQANGGNGGVFQTVNSNLPRGNYIAKLTSGFDTDYNVFFRRASTGAANPLAVKEIEVGTIAQDLRKTDSVSNKDTADNFAFTLDGKSSLNIDVRELGNQKGDVNIRVVQDLNANGFVDKNDIIAKGVSTSKGNMDTITGLNKAGDYILQVCQTKGNTQFEVKFDPSIA